MRMAALKFKFNYVFSFSFYKFDYKSYNKAFVIKFVNIVTGYLLSLYQAKKAL